jgi:hypothetical protein
MILFFRERRQSPRTRARDAVAVRDLNRPGRLTLVDVSLGGFLVETEQPYHADSEAEFEFECPGGGWSMRLRGRLIYCHEADLGDGRLAAGFAFTEQTSESGAARIRSLLERVLMSTSGVAALAAAGPGFDGEAS